MKNILSPTQIASIHEICDKYHIQNYTINNDGSIDVNGNVNLMEKNLDELPVQFNNVTGHFECSINNLTSLKGSPVTVGGQFHCARNKLTTLEYGPKVVNGKTFQCAANRLTSLKGFPKIFKGDYLLCSKNKLTSLKYCPKQLKMIACSANNLESLDYYPENLIMKLKNNVKEFALAFKPFSQLDSDQRKVFKKYQDHYGVWDDDKFHLDMFNDLKLDILDGLR